MITYLRTDLFHSPAQTLVNTVNTVGVMGKGVAKTFKQRYPAMFREYKALCDRGEFRVGNLLLWRGPDQWVLNFPTKTTWRQPSRLEYIERGLQRFRETYEELGIRSISFPPLGCGNGQLDWKQVRPVMEGYLKKVRIPVYIHDRQVPMDFVPEHHEDVAGIPSATFEEFLNDIREVTRGGGDFKTLSGLTSFRATLTPEDDLRIVRQGGNSERIPREELENTWSSLHLGLLTADQFSGGAARRYKSYLFPVIARLPYVTAAEVEHVRGEATSPGHGLFFRPHQAAPHALSILNPGAEDREEQLRLWA